MIEILVRSTPLAGLMVPPDEPDPAPDAVEASLRAAIGGDLIIPPSSELHAKLVAMRPVSI